jgi:hypothetical protein
VNNGLTRTGTGAIARVVVVTVVAGLRRTEVGAGGLVVVVEVSVHVVVVAERVVVDPVPGGC